MDREIEVLNEIYHAVMNINLTEQEAISIIAGIVEERLAEFGMFPSTEQVQL